jgi:hypothetical protein
MSQMTRWPHQPAFQQLFLSIMDIQLKSSTCYRHQKLGPLRALRTLFERVDHTRFFLTSSPSSLLFHLKRHI